MAFVQIKPSAFLSGEECLDPKSFLVPIASLVSRLHIGNEIEGLFVSLIPPENGMNGAIGFEGEKDIRQTHGWLPLYERNVLKGELSLPLKEHIALPCDIHTASHIRARCPRGEFHQTPHLPKRLPVPLQG